MLIMIAWPEMNTMPNVTSALACILRLKFGYCDAATNATACVESYAVNDVIGSTTNLLQWANISSHIH